jgi:hypothetical protein
MSKTFAALAKIPFKQEFQPVRFWTISAAAGE